MDVALSIEKLLPAANYFGSVTANTEKSYMDLNWVDERIKPTWKEIQDAYLTIPESVKNPSIVKAQVKASAVAKLAALGLSADEIAAL